METVVVIVCVAFVTIMFGITRTGIAARSQGGNDKSGAYNRLADLVVRNIARKMNALILSGQWSDGSADAYRKADSCRSDCHPVGMSKSADSVLRTSREPGARHVGNDGWVESNGPKHFLCRRNNFRACDRRPAGGRRVQKLRFSHTTVVG